MPNMSDRKVIVTHHAPDLDAITSTWLLKRFDAQHFADAKVMFVNPGNKLDGDELTQLGYSSEDLTYVDTGFGEFDHHQPERAVQRICAATLVYDHVSHVHPELEDDEALKTIVEYANEIDHFEEIFWPNSDANRNLFLIQELIRGHEFTDPHNDDSQLHFGFQCLDNAYATLTQHHKALEIVKEKGEIFKLANGTGMALKTRNDDTIKLAQRQGHALVIRKDPKIGHIRIKVRPDSDIILQELYDKIMQVDQEGTWFYHGSGKMLLNSSKKDQSHKPSPLSLNEVVLMIKEIYG